MMGLLSTIMGVQERYTNLHILTYVSFLTTALDREASVGHTLFPLLSLRGVPPNNDDYGRWFFLYWDRKVLLCPI